MQGVQAFALVASSFTLKLDNGTSGASLSFSQSDKDGWQRPCLSWRAGARDNQIRVTLSANTDPGSFLFANPRLFVDPANQSGAVAL